MAQVVVSGNTSVIKEILLEKGYQKNFPIGHYTKSISAEGLEAEVEALSTDIRFISAGVRLVARLTSHEANRVLFWKDAGKVNFMLMEEESLEVIFPTTAGQDGYLLIQIPLFLARRNGCSQLIVGKVEYQTNGNYRNGRGVVVENVPLRRVAYRNAIWEDVAQFVPSVPELGSLEGKCLQCGRSIAGELYRKIGYDRMCLMGHIGRAGILNTEREVLLAKQRLVNLAERYIELPMRGVKYYR